MLEIGDLHVSYGQVDAVRGVSLVLQPGQIVSVIGPNGAGKTTLLAAAMGLLPCKGLLRFDGEDLHGLDVEARVERGQHVSAVLLLTSRLKTCSIAPCRRVLACVRPR